MACTHRFTRPFFWIVCLAVLQFTVSCDTLTLNGIAGNITSDGLALSDVAITAVSQNGTVYTSETDTSGRYAIGGMEPGTYIITPAKSGFTFTPAAIETDVPIQGGKDNLNFQATPEDKIKVVLTGDINLGTNVGKLIRDRENGDYTFPFRHLSSYLSSADLTIGNLESIISDKGSCTKLIWGIPLRAAPEAVNGLLYAGFDMLGVANNHIGDYDFEGMEDSLDRIKAAGMIYAGGGKNFEEAHTPAIKTVNNTRIALLAYTNVPMYMDSTGPYSPTPKWIAREDRPGMAWAHDTRFDMYGDLDQMTADIINAKSMADIVIVSVHFGWERHKEPDNNQIELAHRAIDAGASLVVGHHPHVTQPVEIYKGKYIAYSLGNFIFDMTGNDDYKKGMMIEATILGKQIIDVQEIATRINDRYQVEFEETL